MVSPTLLRMRSARQLICLFFCLSRCSDFPFLLFVLVFICSCYENRFLFFILSGLGFAMIIITFFICLYYSVVIAYCFFYFFASMTSELPWSTCDNEWNTCSCRVGVVNNNITDPWNGTKLECGAFALFVIRNRSIFSELSK